MADVIPVPAEMARQAHVDAAGLRDRTARAAADPAGYWLAEARRLAWLKPPTVAGDWSFGPGEVFIRWFADGVLNVAANCIDRHLPARASQTAILWQGDDPAESRAITYAELAREVGRFANVLKSLGVRRGDRVTIYLPMIPEAAFAMLACARIGAVHSVVFAGFSPENLAGRIADAGSLVLVTADEGVRGGRRVPLKANADAALARLGLAAGEQAVLVIRRTGAAVPMLAARDRRYDDLAATASADCPAEPMGAEDPLFILYTSGSTGRPKGVLHTGGGYLLHAALTHEQVFDYRDGDIYWCTADLGWVTGHSYVLYGPLANGATTVMFEGVPGYPTPSRFWEEVDRHRVTIFYTAPTAIRALMGAGDAAVTRTSRATLRVLATVGEPINPEAWTWYHRVVGDGRCPVIDTWWQTETGGHLIAPLPGATPLKPGSATLPLPGIEARIVGAGGEILGGPAEGNLVVAASWPGQARTIWGDHARFVATYFSTWPGLYFTGDGARRDEDGYYWITGRVDDVLNVAGHRLDTAEIESALVAHPAVAEAAVVGYPHPVRGQGIYCFVTLMQEAAPSPALETELKAAVRAGIGPIATPDHIQFAPGLPKTRSGKIMRRILRKIAEDDFAALGDTSTLAEPAVVDDLVANRRNRSPRGG